MHKVIARSGSGKTYVILNPDNTIGFNSTEPIMSLSNLKWLRGQSWFKQGFLSRISDDLLNGVDSVELDIKRLPITKRYIMTQRSIAGGCDIITIRSYHNNFFCHFSHTDDVVFVGSTPLMTRPSYGEDAIEVSAIDPIENVISNFEAEMLIQKQKREIAHNNWLKEMYEPLKGWYVVTIDILVSKIHGNDGVKSYSFKVLADNRMDAYEKTVKLVNDHGLEDKNVSFVYEIKDSAKSALIEFVGIWTDEAELEYGPTA